MTKFLLATARASNALLKGSAEQSLRLEQQQKNQYSERHDILERSPEEGAAEGLQHAEQKSAGHRPAQAREAADHRRNERLDDQLADLGIDADQRREQQASDRADSSRKCPRRHEDRFNA